MRRTLSSRVCRFVLRTIHATVDLGGITFPRESDCYKQVIGLTREYTGRLINR